jgi:hypothetical protein
VYSEYSFEIIFISDFRYIDCHLLSDIMLSAIMLSVLLCHYAPSSIGYTINSLNNSLFLSPGVSQQDRYIPQHRVVHLDLKGSPPKLSFLKNIFPLLKEGGATALLIEYEDMFPYWGPLRNISARNSYSKQEVQGPML